MSIFPCPWRRRSVWKPGKKCSGNCWIAANYTWSETNCPKSKPLKGPHNPSKSRCRPKNRLLKTDAAAYPTEVTHDRQVSEKLSDLLDRPMKYWGYIPHSLVRLGNDGEERETSQRALDFPGVSSSYV